MTGLGLASVATTTVAAGQLMSALVSPLPLLIVAGMAVLIWVPIAVLLLTPVWSRCPKRNARAGAMIDRVLAAFPRARNGGDEGT